jgi:hypothetical protein
METTFSRSRANRDPYLAVGDTRKPRQHLSWSPKVGVVDGLQRMTGQLREVHSLGLPEDSPRTPGPFRRPAIDQSRPASAPFVDFFLLKYHQSMRCKMDRQCSLGRRLEQ